MSDNPIRPFSSASFNAYLEENRLMASHCDQCDQSYLPPRAVCPSCFGAHMSWRELDGTGSVAAITTVYIGPTFMNSLGYSREKPYMCGIVELDDGLRISARLLGSEEFDLEEVQIGSPVRVTFLRVGDEHSAKTQLAFLRE